MQQQQYIGTAHALQDLLASALTADRVGFNAPEVPHGGVLGVGYCRCRYRIQRAAVDMQFHASIQVRLLVQQKIQRGDGAGQIAGFGQ